MPTTAQRPPKTHDRAPEKDRLWLFLIGLGLFLAGFSFFISSPQIIQAANSSLRSGRIMNDDLVFWLADIRVKGLAMGLVLVLVGILRRQFLLPLRKFLSPDGRDPLEGRRSSRSQWLDLFLISGLALFAELIIIRWLAVEMRVFAYFKNVPLISCFLGLGLGAALGEGKGRLRFESFPFWFSLLGAIIVFFGHRLVFLNPAGNEDFIWGIGRSSGFVTQLLAITIFLAVVVFVFVWNTRVFMMLGYLTGRMLSGLSPLAAYSVNIAGSLVGIWLFTLFSHWATPPAAWFAVALFGFLVFLRRSPRTLIVMAVVSILFVGFLALRKEPHQVFWSPYYKISLIPHYAKSKVTGQDDLAGYRLRVNEDSHQTGMNYSDDFLLSRVDGERPAARILELPFRLKASPKALIVGSGMGNDVAAALRTGAESVTAVEIDPMILKLGRTYHPENPYGSPKVHVVNDDARAFFKKTKDKYDLVVFGILDSHTQFSSMSNLRLDNYVYTIESLRDAKALLKPGGILSITFAGDAKNLWMGARFHKMLTEVFGKEPVALDVERMMFLAGENITRDGIARNEYFKGFFPDGEVDFKAAPQVPPATDDWPFMYLKGRKIPNIYFGMIFLLCAIAWGFLKKYLGEGRAIDLHFFFLGAGFLLMETKAITELALVYGTTWVVNSIVFSGIMVMILVANLIVKKISIQTVTPAYIGLAITLILSYFCGPVALTGLAHPWNVLLSTAVVLVPLFFAAIIFAVSFSGVRNIPLAFGSNLIGAVVGGFAEYLSLVTGVRFLALLGLAFYIVSFLALTRKWQLRF